MSSKKKTPAIVKTGILTAITVIVWIVFEVVKILMSKAPPAVSADILAPVNPTLDESALNKLQNRMYINPEEIGNNTIKLPQTNSAIDLKTTNNNNKSTATSGGIAQ